MLTSPHDGTMTGEEGTNAIQVGFRYLDGNVGLYVTTSRRHDVGTVAIRELKAKASEIVRSVEQGEAFLVTKRGRPVAVVLPFDVDAEDLILAEGDPFVRMRARARTELRGGRTTSWRAVRTKKA